MPGICASPRTPARVCVPVRYVYVRVGARACACMPMRVPTCVCVRARAPVRRPKNLQIV